MTHPAEPSRIRAARERGVSLIEGVLYLVIVASVVVLTAQLIDQETTRQEDVAMAANLNIFLDGSQDYIASNYDQVRRELLDAAESGGSATMSVTMGELATRGFIPSAFTANTENLFGQDYSLLVRAVRGDDTAVPQATMTRAQIDSNLDGKIDPDLADRNPDNDEMYVESILVSHGGDAAPTTRGAPITARTDKSTAGFVSEAGTARGPYANFVFDISGFSGDPLYPEVGHFASIVSLSDFGVVGQDKPGIPNNDGIEDPWRRCIDILNESDVTREDDQYQECLHNNHMYSNVILRKWDSDGDGIDDTVPRIDGTNFIKMMEPWDSDGDGNPDEFSILQNPELIKMMFPQDTDGDGIDDRFGKIANLGQILCSYPPTTNGSVGTLLIDCDDVRLDADTEITGDAAVGGDLDVTGNATADRFISTALGGQDMSEAVFNTRVLRSQETVAKPTCPATTPDGNFAIEPRIYVIPASYSHPGGLPTVGVRAFAEEADADNWRVRLFDFVDEDQCTSSIADPLTLNTSDFRAENAAACSTSDGKADVYEIPGNAGRVLAMTRCY